MVVNSPLGWTPMLGLHAQGPVMPPFTLSCHHHDRHHIGTVLSHPQSWCKSHDCQCAPGIFWSCGTEPPAQGLALPMVCHQDFWLGTWGGSERSEGTNLEELRSSTGAWPGESQIPCFLGEPGQSRSHPTLTSMGSVMSRTVSGCHCRSEQVASTGVYL